MKRFYRPAKTGALSPPRRGGVARSAGVVAVPLPMLDGGGWHALRCYASGTVAVDTWVPERAYVRANRRAMTFRASVLNALLEAAHDARRMRRVTGGSFVDTACCVAALHS